MSRTAMGAAAVSALLCIMPATADAEILAMMNYESKTPDSVKALKLSGVQERREGIAIIDVDPDSTGFGRILMEIPMPSDQVVHHIFYDRTMSKAYITALGSPSLQVMDLGQFPYRLKTIDVAGCKMAEDVVFDENNKRWFLTCMNSANVFVGDVDTDKVVKRVDIPGTFPHGLAVNSTVNRMLVTSTVSGDLKNIDDVVTVLDATTYKILDTKRMAVKDGKAGEGPVEILFAPGANPPVAYVTNLFGGKLWTMTWNAATSDFDARQAFDFASINAGIALELYFNDAADRLYVTSGKPGQLHIFDVAGHPAEPKLLASLPAGEGAHHVAITKDERYGFVQNALLNLPGLSDGAVTAIDLKKGEVVRSMDTLKNMGMNPNSIVLLPQWNNLAGH